jgi:hypothetical protein
MNSRQRRQRKRQIERDGYRDGANAVDVAAWHIMWHARNGGMRSSLKGHQHREHLQAAMEAAGPFSWSESLAIERDARSQQPWEHKA